jgi:membrane protein required for colicin V production
LTVVAALDWILLAMLLLSCLIGMWRGLVYEGLVLAGWVAAFFAARWAGPPVGFWLPLGGASATLRTGLGCTLVFIVVAFVCGWFAWRIRRTVRVMGLRPVDGLLGAVFGAARAVAVLLVAVALAHLTPLVQEPWWHASVGVRWLETALRQITPDLPPQAARYLSA